MHFIQKGKQYLALSIPWNENKIKQYILQSSTEDVFLPKLYLINYWQKQHISDIYTSQILFKILQEHLWIVLWSPFMRKISRKSILYLGSKIWDELDRNIKISTSTNNIIMPWKNNFLKRFFITIIMITKIIRDQIKQFRIANYQSFLICSKSKTTFPQLFHEP